VHETSPCGFCGCFPPCPVWITQTGKVKKITSACPDAHDSYTYPTENKSTGPNPCTNVPIICPLCDPPMDSQRRRAAIFKYNFEAHVRLAHPTFATPGWPAAAGVHSASPGHPGLALSSEVPSQLISHLELGDGEEKRLGMAISTPWRFVGLHETTTPAPLPSSSSKRPADAALTQAHSPHEPPLPPVKKPRISKSVTTSKSATTQKPAVSKPKRTSRTKALPDPSLLPAV
jgi:hypothetical protein